MIDPNYKVKINGITHKVVNNKTFYFDGIEFVLSSKPAEFIREQYKRSLKKLEVKDFEIFSGVQSI